jgi:cell division protein FtsQ
VVPERDASTGSRARVAQRDAGIGRDARVPGPRGRPGQPRRGGHPRGDRGREPPARSGGRWKAAFFTLTAAAIAAATGWALLGSSLLVARSVRVTGAPQAQRAEVLSAAGIALGTPLIRIDPAAVARRVERIPQIQSAEISRDWPDTVLIAVRERTPALAVPAGAGFALVDRFGVVVSRVARRPPGMVLLGAPPADLAALRGSPAIGAAVTVLHELPPSIRRLVRAVTAPSAGAVTLDLQHGVTVLWGGTGEPAAKAAELAILMRTRASFYDVSDPATAVTGG